MTNSRFRLYNKYHQFKHSKTVIKKTREVKRCGYNQLLKTWIVDGQYCILYEIRLFYPVAKSGLCFRITSLFVWEKSFLRGINLRKFGSGIRIIGKEKV